MLHFKVLFTAFILLPLVWGCSETNEPGTCDEESNTCDNNPDPNLPQLTEAEVEQFAMQNADEGMKDFMAMSQDQCGGEDGGVAGAIAGRKKRQASLSTTYYDLCPEYGYWTSPLYVYDYSGRWGYLVNINGQRQYLRHQKCTQDTCKVVSGRCKQEYRYQQVLVVQWYYNAWRLRFTWMKLRSCCSCEASCYGLFNN